jgi:hypothetical protein
MNHMRRIGISGLLTGSVLFWRSFCPSLPAVEAILPASNTYAKWVHGPPSDPSFFPIAVWLQSPANAEKYRQAGINTYVALWKGPTDEQLASLKKAGVRLICSQNQTALKHLDDPTIIGWMHGDEPDNAQALPSGQGWGPPIKPEVIVRDYERIQKADPSRPVMLNLGQGVAWPQYYGRGVRSNHPEDYPEYIKGCDIASFDIYPVVHERAEIAGKLWFVAQGVERLVQWSAGEKIVWNCLECTRISNPDRKATPQQVRSEAWMSLIHGSRGLIYFVHQFKPVFREAALLDDKEMLEGVTALNQEILRLAPVLNGPTLADAVSVSGSGSVPIATMAKQHQGFTYLFAVAMRDTATGAGFKLKGIKSETQVEVLGENRSISVKDGAFRDDFGPWGVHLYRVPH